MTVQMPCAGLLILSRLVRIHTHPLELYRHRYMSVKCHSNQVEMKRFSTACVKCSNDDREGSKTQLLTTKQVARQSLLSRRSLSPLERISSLLPQDALGPEVMQLRDQNHPHEEETYTEEHSSSDPSSDAKDGPSLKEKNPDHCNDVAAQQMETTLQRKTILAYGELLVAEYHKKGCVEFRKMFQLQLGTRLLSSWGIILHDDVVGQPAAHVQRTSRGVPIFIRRASLEDYVLYMKRGPAISYPKDASAMLLMMDVTEGDYVLDSGSGSGAMSLFLSRAVGSRGSVLSIDIREDHLKRAMLNYQRWRAAWRARQGEEWPDNVALDLISPQLVLPTVIPHLHPGAVCAVYLANITQVIDLLEGIRCTALPLLCERIFDIPTRDWLVGPARLKDGRYCSKKAPSLNGAPVEEENASVEVEQDEDPAFGSIPYIARPHPQQLSHTAFLVKLRKFVT
ncbi:tRNA (adenine(58)-N(1))-methyltransferase, mitochondrial isoform X3 [Syngnathus typhle]|uniref:tRNA (adenine(58)-N(1))-methyltransferase, mitochondrial isoform X3 n=1 Tax=Syngnathus typhle TaxID=161592 RepID=UPI002A69F6FB|nr:tRNA (adenine(58)-N(1))-methyltransferase, mitochondrial isoform X3 [Syngnathus typhle]